MEQEGAPSEEDFSAQLQAYRAQNADDNERSPASFFEAVLHVDTVLHTVDSATEERVPWHDHEARATPCERAHLVRPICDLASLDLTGSSDGDRRL